MGMASTGVGLGACSSSSSSVNSGGQSYPAAIQRLIMVFRSGLSRSARSLSDRRIPHSVAGPAGSLPAFSSDPTTLKSLWLSRSMHAESEESYSAPWSSSQAGYSPQSDTGISWTVAGPGNVESSYNYWPFRSHCTALRGYHIP